MYFLSYICKLFLAALKRPPAFWPAFYRKFARVLHRRPVHAVRKLAGCPAHQLNFQAPTFPARFRFGPYANGPP